MSNNIMPPTGPDGWDVIEVLGISPAATADWEFRGYSNEGFEVRVPTDTDGKLLLAVAALEALLAGKEGSRHAAAASLDVLRQKPNQATELSRTLLSTRNDLITVRSERWTSTQAARFVGPKNNE